jgi:Ca2+-binding EF-hand superfamily protein
MANENEKQQLKEKLELLIAAKFEGDALTAFAYYDMDGDGKMNRSELMDLLRDAGVGNWLTRGRWVDRIMATLDKDADGMIALDDLDPEATQ